MFNCDLYEDEIFEILSEFFADHGENVSEEVITELSSHIYELCSSDEE